MNNKGFTLIEVVGIVLILALIFLVSFPNLLNTINLDEEKKYNNMVKDLCLAGESYIYANEEEYEENFLNNRKIDINISSLIQYGNVKDGLINPKNDKSINNDRLVFRANSDKSLKCLYLLEYDLEKFNISVNGTNINKISGDNIIYETKEANLTIGVTSSEEYVLPDSITVSGAELKEYSKTTGKISIYKPTDNVIITAKATRKYKITVNATNATYSGDTYILDNATASLNIKAIVNYILPSTIEVQNALYDYNSTTGNIELSNPTGNVVITIIGKKGVYMLGNEVYFDVSKGVGCSRDEYESSYDSSFNGGDYLNSKTGYNGINKTSNKQNSCLKFYALNVNDVSNNLTLDLILDHNTTDIYLWANESDYEAAPGTGSYGFWGNNNKGPVTALKKLKLDTNDWKGTIVPENYSKDNYIINYSANNLKARFISNEDLKLITGISARNYNCYASLSDEDLYSWLFDRTSTKCKTKINGCQYNSDAVTFGYWTSSVCWNESTSKEKAIGVSYTGAFSGGFVGGSSACSDCDKGIRPVITIYKNQL